MSRAASDIGSPARAERATEPTPWQAIAASAAEHRPIFALLVAYLVLAYSVDVAIPEHRIVSLHVYDSVFFVMLALYVVVFVFGYALYAAHRVPPGARLLPSIGRAVVASYLGPARLTAFVLMVVYARVLTDTYVSLKAAIPLVQPFAWDETFMWADQALHLGRHPWEWIQPLATPLATTFVNFCYNVWIFVLFAVFIWQAWSANRELRRRFFLTFGLAWMLIGTLAAAGLSSAGPCYYGRVTGGGTDPYAPLMSYLHEVDGTHRVWALDVQEALWHAYVKQQSKITGTPRMHDAQTTTHAGSASSAPATETGDSVDKMLNGISAMPSMHVAMAVLFALLAWNVHAAAGIAFTLYAVIIQIGSVHLGWHYAIDGYVSAIAISLLWIAVGRASAQASPAPALESKLRATQRAPFSPPPLRSRRR